jgi:hypothetical protein
MADLIGTAGVEIDAIESRYMQGPKPWIFRYQRLGDELIYGPRLSCGLSGMVRFFCLCRCFCEYRPEGRDVPAEDIRASCLRPLIGGKLMRLTDKVAMVTGGAHGMGEAEARLFAAEGARVIVADILESEAEIVASDIRGGGKEAMAAKLDVTSESEWME